MTKRKSAKAITVVGLPRDLIANRAQALASDAVKKLPRGTRVVVVLTDASGEWVGVGSNTNPQDVKAILESSLLGADRRSATVIDALGQEITEPR